MSAIVSICVVDAEREGLYDACVRVGRRMFYVEQDRESYADRAYRLCVLSCPCAKHQALAWPDEDSDDFVAGPSARARMTKVLAAATEAGEFRWDELVQRRVSDVIRDALGDFARRRAAGTSFTGRPERPLAKLPMSVGAKEVMTRLIRGATGRRDNAPLAFFTGRCDVATAAAYVADSIRSSRRTAAAGPHPLAALTVAQLAEFVREGRATIIAVAPDRWATLIEECQGRSDMSLESVVADGDDLGRHRFRRFDGDAGFSDPADLVSASEGESLARPLALVEEAPTHAILEHLVAAVDKGCTEVTAWLAGPSDAPPTEQVVGWLDVTRCGRKRSAAFVALRALPREELAGMLKDARRCLQMYHAPYWELLVRRARRRLG
jgi:hypothetical protein